uniref:hypothetical protein n=1 Tax=Brachybacterium sp. GPGPB12 TaxID=3023517 RepID=UPI00404A1451
MLSWAGDTLPRFLDGQAQFLAMLGAFLLAQIVYALALWPPRGGSLLARPAAVSPLSRRGGGDRGPVRPVGRGARCPRWWSTPRRSARWRCSPPVSACAAGSGERCSWSPIPSLP